MLITNEEEELRQALTFTESVVPERIAADPEIVENGLAKLVLSIIELIRRLLEKQAIWDPLESTCRHASLSIL